MRIANGTVNVLLAVRDAGTGVSVAEIRRKEVPGHLASVTAAAHANVQGENAIQNSVVHAMLVLLAMTKNGFAAMVR